MFENILGGWRYTHVKTIVFLDNIQGSLPIIHRTHTLHTQIRYTLYSVTHCIKCTYGHKREDELNESLFFLCCQLLCVHVLYLAF